MFSKFEPGFIVVIVAMLLFYLRVAMLRGKKRREARAAELAYKRDRSKGKKVERPPQIGKDIPTYQVASWWLVGIGGLLMVAGLAMRTTLPFIPVEILPYWWVVTTAGVVVFGFSLK